MATAMTDAATKEASTGEEFRRRDERARRALDPAEVRRLSKLSPLRATISLLQTWGLVVALFAIAIRFPRPWVIALSMVGIAGAQHGLAILAHQSAHYRMYETRWLNDVVGRLCGLPLFVSVITYRVIHRIHHNHLYTAIDPDLALMAGYPRGRAYLLKKLVKDLTGVTTVKNYLYFFGKTPTSRRDDHGSRPLDDTSSTLRAAAKRDRALVLVVHALSLPILIYTGAFRVYLLLWIVPLVTLLQALLRLRAVCEHGATPDGVVAGRAPDPRRAARTTIAPAYVKWLLFPHDMNFHVEHHLYPSVPHYRLAECHRALHRQRLLDDAEVVPTMRETLRRVFA